MGTLQRYLLFAATMLSVVFWRSSAHADVVWPALMMVPRLLSLPVVFAGIVIEAVCLKYLFALSLQNSVGKTVIVNAVSATVGILLIPLAGFLWELGPGQLVNSALNEGTFNPISWTATLLLAAAISTVIESVCLDRFFAMKLSMKGMCIWFGANLASTGLALFGLSVSPSDNLSYKPLLF